MDQDEVRRRVIGLLTAAYHTAGQEADIVGRQNEIKDELNELIGPLVQGLGASKFTIARSDLEDPAALAEAVASQVTRQLMSRMNTMIGIFTAAFVRLCREYEKDCPDADISGLLRQLGLIVVSDI
jgi:hypothetical protein